MGRYFTIWVGWIVVIGEIDGSLSPGEDLIDLSLSLAPAISHPPSDLVVPSSNHEASLKLSLAMTNSPLSDTLNSVGVLPKPSRKNLFGSYLSLNSNHAAHSPIPSSTLPSNIDNCWESSEVSKFPETHSQKNFIKPQLERLTPAPEKAQKNASVCPPKIMGSINLEKSYTKMFPAFEKLDQMMFGFQLPSRNEGSFLKYTYSLQNRLAQENTIPMLENQDLNRFHNEIKPILNINTTRFPHNQFGSKKREVTWMNNSESSKRFPEDESEVTSVKKFKPEYLHVEQRKQKQVLGHSQASKDSLNRMIKSSSEFLSTELDNNCIKLDPTLDKFKSEKNEISSRYKLSNTKILRNFGLKSTEIETKWKDSKNKIDKILFSKMAFKQDKKTEFHDDQKYNQILEWFEKPNNEKSLALHNGLNSKLFKGGVSSRERCMIHGISEGKSPIQNTRKYSNNNVIVTKSIDNMWKKYDQWILYWESFLNVDIRLNYFQRKPAYISRIQKIFLAVLFYSYMIDEICNMIGIDKYIKKKPLIEISVDQFQSMESNGFFKIRNDSGVNNLKVCDRSKKYVFNWHKTASKTWEFLYYVIVTAQRPELTPYFIKSDKKPSPRFKSFFNDLFSYSILNFQEILFNDIPKG